MHHPKLVLAMFDKVFFLFGEVSAPIMGFDENQEQSRASIG